MIRVDVEDYCHACLDFTPDVIKPERYSASTAPPDSTEVFVYYTDTVVQCKYRKRCAGIKRYLEQQTKGEVSG